MLRTKAPFISFLTTVLSPSPLIFKNASVSVPSHHSDYPLIPPSPRPIKTFHLSISLNLLTPLSSSSANHHYPSNPNQSLEMTTPVESLLEDTSSIKPILRFCVNICFKVRERVWVWLLVVDIPVFSPCPVTESLFIS